MDGQLPRSLVNCSKLEVLDVGNNNIEDTFPHWLESLTNLQVLVLRSNKFHGSVQSIKESPTFPKLRVLDLSNNDFLGPLPIRYVENFRAMMGPHRDHDFPEYMMMGSYQYSLVLIMKGFEYELHGILIIFISIDLSNNKFEGEIPDVIGKLSSLKGLNLLITTLLETLDCVEFHDQNLVMEMGHNQAPSKKKMTSGDLAGEWWCIVWIGGVGRIGRGRDGDGWQGRGSEGGCLLPPVWVSKEAEGEGDGLIRTLFNHPQICRFAIRPI
ncbi:hypothetical protein SLEP1_g46562 [Rubroshorea leprosula]|uniref:Uncharacterized protein n=1 Tax=Rubroshorea leprosula TaxID=152421 RepID=A0AAV5LPF9_9ROSI|nr:hypothetical protein SLEP1_g46562 [Rubroshorea leprosula]